VNASNTCELGQITCTQIMQMREVSL